MSETTWEIPSISHSSHTSGFYLDSRDVAGTPDNWSVVTRTLQSGVSQGVEMIEVNNGKMTLSILATRGLGVWDAKVGQRRLGWHSPVRGPVHPQYVSLMEPLGTGWLSGFDELMVRCGLESNGSAVFDNQGRLRFPLHGRIANRPAHGVQIAVDAQMGTITVRGAVDEIRFHHQKLRLVAELTTTFGTTAFAWRDVVHNLSAAPATMQLIYHINVGSPLLVPGTALVAPVRIASPHDRYPDDVRLRNYRHYPELGSTPSQQSFFFELLADAAGKTQILLAPPSNQEALALRWNTNQLPYFTQWRNNAPAEDGYVTALEPGTNYPNPRPFEEEQNRIVKLPPHGSWSTEVALDWILEPTRIATVRDTIASIQGSVVPTILHEPQKGISARA